MVLSFFKRAIFLLGIIVLFQKASPVEGKKIVIKPKGECATINVGASNEAFEVLSGQTN